MAFNHITRAITATQDLILKFNVCPWDQLFTLSTPLHRSHWRLVQGNSTVYFRKTHVFAMNHYHMNKGNQSLTQHHTGLSGARCKVSQQTASAKLTNLKLINNQLANSSPSVHQSRPLAFNHITRAIAATQDPILKVNMCPWDQLFTLSTPLHPSPHSGARCKVTQQSVSK